MFTQTFPCEREKVRWDVGICVTHLIGVGGCISLPFFNPRTLNSLGSGTAEVDTSVGPGMGCQDFELLFLTWTRIKCCFSPRSSFALVIPPALLPPTRGNYQKKTINVVNLQRSPLPLSYISQLENEKPAPPFPHLNKNRRKERSRKTDQADTRHRTPWNSKTGSARTGPRDS